MPQTQTLIAIRWQEKSSKPHHHPAFSSAINEGSWFVLHYPRGAHISRAKTAQTRWANDKLQHLASFGVTGQIQDKSSN